uniref:Uncharacterized protein n=1 Tax=Manihot esculenta TaxID=3983 RepID=A0A2C9UPY3_MANES
MGLPILTILQSRQSSNSNLSDGLNSHGKLAVPNAQQAVRPLLLNAQPASRPLLKCAASKCQPPSKIAGSRSKWESNFFSIIWPQVSGLITLNLGTYKPR